MRLKKLDKIYLKRRKIPQWMTCALLVYPLLLPMLLGFFHLPQVIKYVPDILWFGLLVIMLSEKKLVFKRKMLPQVIIAVIFFVYTAFVYCVNFQSPFYYLWGVRNSFRMYAAFFAFSTFMDQEDVESCFEFLDVLFWSNCAVCMVQFFFMGYEQDYLGGIFGVERGCNGQMNNFFCVVISKSVLLYIQGRESTVRCFLKCGASLILASLAELKVYYVLFVLILIISFVSTPFSGRKLVLALFSVIALSVGISILGELFGSADFFFAENLLRYTQTTGYASQEDLGRFTALSTLSDTILTDMPSRLFGLGLGNCDTAGFEICNTPFYKTYSHLHYTWFSSAFLFLETGYIGLGLYLLFFVSCFCCAARERKEDTGEPLYAQMAAVMSVVCVVLVFYNSSLRTEAGYMAFFVLALPFVDAGKACIKIKN